MSFQTTLDLFYKPTNKRNSECLENITKDQRYQFLVRDLASGINVLSFRNRSEVSFQTTLDLFLKPATKRTLESSGNSKNAKRIKLIGKGVCVEESAGNLPPSNECMEIFSYCQRWELLYKTMGHTWFRALKNEFEKPYFTKLWDFIDNERKTFIIYPPEEMVWSWTRECSIDNIKAVIVGDKPYHNPEQAHGLCFSVPFGVPIPPSLLNVYKELQHDINNFKMPKHGHLVGWARQGVLLLNDVLTIKDNTPDSHRDVGWENLTSAVIKYLDDNHHGIVFMLWGSSAQKKADFIDKKKHCVLKATHPSSLRDWFGCKHFSKCNEYFKNVGKTPIDWSFLPGK